MRFDLVRLDTVKVILILFPLFSHTHITHDITRRYGAGSHQRTMAEKRADSVVHHQGAV